MGWCVDLEMIRRIIQISLLKNVIKAHVPFILISRIKYIYFLLIDIINLSSGKNEELVPPLRLMFDGPRNIEIFKKSGDEFLKYYKDLCDFKPEQNILDVGSGIGRKTIPLIRYINKNGRYNGLDISKIGINWCKNNISTKHENFVFKHIDVHNKIYNPNGRILASDLIFPYDSNCFDLVVANSLFTHMLPKDINNYLKEISRVLKYGGKCFCTFFLLEKKLFNTFIPNSSSPNFQYKYNNYRTNNKRAHEDAVCYPENFIFNLLETNNLIVVEPINYGAWNNGDNALTFQDIIIANKIKR